MFGEITISQVNIRNHPIDSQPLSKSGCSCFWIPGVSWNEIFAVFSSPVQVEDNEDPNEGPKEDGDGDMQRE